MTARKIVTDSRDSAILKGMKGHGNEPWLKHGSVKRFIEKAIYGMRKDNEREARAGSLANVKRSKRAQLQNGHPDASSATVEAMLVRSVSHGMKPYQPPSYLAKAAPEENLVSEKDRAKSQRKNGRGSRKQ
ncbi:hypothetical protein WBP06_00530 [Novosphingobium sp. BL-8H]|uniref:hypothetical protein n=1 Tax=Novosphingobium sp. BL-8H TaxID=3127640 RepID=UPI003756F98C